MQKYDEPIIVGQAAGFYGIKGWIKVISFTRPVENIFSYRPWQFHVDDKWHELSCVQYKRHGRNFIVQLDGMEDREAAKLYKHADIGIYRDQLPDPAPGEYYWQDLLHKEVIDTEGKVLGKVKEIWETGANDVLVVEGEQRHLIPCVTHIYIKEVNLADNHIKVDWHNE